jgi:hypothetical protein
VAADWVWLALFVTLPALFAVAIHLVVRRFIPENGLLPHHDVIFALTSIVSVLYAVVLGFLVVTVWASYETAQQTSDLEASYVSDAFAAALALPEPQRSVVRRSLAAYAVEVRDVEWPIFSRSGQDMHARALLGRAIRSVNVMPVGPPGNEAGALRIEFVRQAALLSLRDIADQRRLRLLQARSHLPRLMWVALCFGALIVMSFVFLFEVANKTLQLIMTGLVAACLGLLLGLVVELDSPYGGAVRVSPDTWTFIIDGNHFARVAAGELQ